MTDPRVLIVAKGGATDTPVPLQRDIVRAPAVSKRGHVMPIGKEDCVSQHLRHARQ